MAELRDGIAQRLAGSAALCGVEHLGRVEEAPLLGRLLTRLPHVHGTGWAAGVACSESRVGGACLLKASPIRYIRYIRHIRHMRSIRYTRFTFSRRRASRRSAIRSLRVFFLSGAPV